MYWQEIVAPRAPCGEGYAAQFDDGRVLMLPIRPIPGKSHGLASLIINQASFAVLDALAVDLADKLAAHRIDVIVGLPTLGLTLAGAVARTLGHTRYVPLGTSLKFWYDTTLSVPLSSVTTPDQLKRLYIDPRMLPVLEGRRVALIDDVISSGTSMAAGVALLERCNHRPVVLGAAMLQSERWRSVITDYPIETVLRTPLIELPPT